MPLDLVPVEHDPFATAKPGKVVPRQNVLGDLNAATAAAGRMVAPNLSAYVNAPPAPNGLVPTANGKLWSDPGAAALMGPIADIAGLALMGVGGAETVAARALPEVESASIVLARKASGLYNPPVKSARPFAADYPTGAQSDAAGNLATDIEGRPLTAPVIAGRRMVGQPDVAVSPQELDAVATAGLGRQPASVAASQIRGNAGLFTTRAGPDGPVNNIFIDRDLSDAAKDQVLAHETGHLIDYMAAGKAGIPQSGLSAELKNLFNVGVTGQERSRNLTLPEHIGYPQDQIPGEYMAEAIRAYMTDPNAMKAMAPKTAAAIRAAVNNNPRLSKIIQFNAVPAAAGLGAAGYQLVPVDHDPFAQ
jgi:hypothetical protein